MKTIPLEPGGFYHIYNRGINSEDIFKCHENYSYFLNQYKKYVSPIAETWAYCLLKNHFHFLVRIRIEPVLKILPNGNKYIMDPSKQFAHFFNSYAQAINKQHHRTGGLFESPFKRKSIKNETHLAQLVWYINSNAQHHQFVNDFREWPHSSYHSIIDNSETFLAKPEILNWFGDRGSFINFHLGNKSILDELVIE